MRTLILLIVVACSWPSIALGARQPTPLPLSILIANDDGFDAPGLIALVDSLATIGEITVAAPTREESAMGHSISYRDPIMVREIPNERKIPWYAIDARPATVVRLALSELLSEPPDLVVTGINSGANVGLDVWVSGTVAGAREGAFRGIPSIATSRTGDADYRVVAGIVKRMIIDLRARGALVPGLLLNVNVPPGARDIQIVRQSQLTGDYRYERRASPRAGDYFWDRWTPAVGDSAGTDLEAVRTGFVSVTPLSFDQTDAEALVRLRALLGGR